MAYLIVRLTVAHASSLGLGLRVVAARLLDGEKPAGISTRGDRALEDVSGGQYWLMEGRNGARDVVADCAWTSHPRVERTAVADDVAPGCAFLKRLNLSARSQV